MTAKYSIGDFSKKTGTTIRTLHYYDEIGLLKPALITESGRRFYSDDELIKLQKIVSLKFLGYSLEKINEFVHLKDWHIKDSLMFQKNEMIQKKKHIENVIRALDNALHILEDEEKGDPAIFISLINNIQLENEHKEWLKGVISEDTVAKIYDISEEKQLELNKRAYTLFTDLKKSYGQDPASEQIQKLIEEYMNIFDEITGYDIGILQEILDNGTEIDDDPQLFPSPFSAEEEEWTAKAMKIYLKERGVKIDGEE